MKTCSQCVYDDTLPNITFDSHGFCNYYKDFNKLVAEYPIGDAGWKKFQVIAAQVKKVGRHRKFDCFIGVSRENDSSNLIYLGKEKHGLHPLADHFENMWIQRLFISNTVNTRQEKKREQT